MKKVFKNFLVVMVAMMTSLGFAACSNDDTKQTDPVNLKGKWLMMSDNYKELLIINADHTLLSTGADTEDAWASVSGRIALNGNSFTITSEDGDNSTGSFKLEENKLTLYIDGEAYVYNKMIEDFTINGSWKCINTQSFIKAAKDSLQLPFGSIVNGEEIPTVIKTANIKGEFISEAVKAYFKNVEFKDNGDMAYSVVKAGVDTLMTKKYVLSENMLTVTGKVGSIDINNRFMAFQSQSTTETFLFLTKENIADMFVGYGLMLREGNVSTGSVESLEAFKKEFMEAFENFAAIIYLQKQ